MRTFTFAVAAVAVATLAVTPAATGSTNDDPTVGLPGLTDSADLPGTPVVVGEVQPGAGSAEGEMILLYAWPSAEQLSRLAIGETVKSVPIGFGYVESDGSFEIKIADPAIAEPYESASGAVTVQLLTVAGDEVFSETTTLREAQIAGDTAAPTEITLDEGVEAIVEAADTTTVEKSCETSKVASLGNFWTYVGLGYITDTTVARMDFSYSKSAESTLGAGFSASGAAGSFSLSGTSTVASSFTADFPATAGYKGWQAQVTYGKYLRRCVGIGDVVTTYSAIAEQTTGGTRVVSLASAPSATYCVPEPKDVTITINTTKASTVTGGVQSAGTLGVNLSARTGYATNAKIAFNFLKAARLCGTAGNPATGSPGQLVAKPAA